MLGCRQTRMVTDSDRMLDVLKGLLKLRLAYQSTSQITNAYAHTTIAHLNRYVLSPPMAYTKLLSFPLRPRNRHIPFGSTDTHFIVH